MSADVSVSMIGNRDREPPACPSAIPPYVRDREDDPEQEDDADGARAARIDESTPRGACRPASSVSSPNVPAVSKPYTTNSGHEHADQEDRQVADARLVLDARPSRKHTRAG